MPTSVWSLPIGCRSRPGIGLSGVRSSRPGSSWPPLRQWISVGLHAVFVLHHAAHPDHGGDLIFRQADALAAQVLRRLDAGVGADVDAGMAEQPRHEGRDADIGRGAGRDGAHVARERQLRDVEFLVAEGAEENLLGIERQVGDGAALDLDAAVLDRAACGRNCRRRSLSAPRPLHLLAMFGCGRTGRTESVLAYIRAVKPIKPVALLDARLRDNFTSKSTSLSALEREGERP